MNLIIINKKQSLNIFIISINNICINYSFWNKEPVFYYLPLFTLYPIPSFFNDNRKLILKIILELCEYDSSINPNLYTSYFFLKHLTRKK